MHTVKAVIYKRELRLLMKAYINVYYDDSVSY